MNNTGNIQSSTSALYGTKTEQNLRRAFMEESEAFTRGSIYSDLADTDGNISASRSLREQQDNDKRHAELWLGYLDELGDTLENLASLTEGKDRLSGDVYEEMASVADDEGFYEIAEKMRLVSSVKNAHAQELRRESERLRSNGNYNTGPDTLWHCSICGYDIRGNTPPERCPLCSYPGDIFSPVG